MDYGEFLFFKAFEQLCNDVADIKAAVVTLSTQADDRAAMKAMAGDVKGHGEGLQQAVDGAKAAGGV